MGVFETKHAKKYCVGSGLALETPIPAHTKGQKSCLWIPRMGVFETHRAKNVVRFWAGAANSHACAHHGSQKMFLDTWDGYV